MRFCAWCGRGMGHKCGRCGAAAISIFGWTLCKRLHLRRDGVETHGICAGCLRGLKNSYRQSHSSRKTVPGFDPYLKRTPDLLRLFDLEERRRGKLQ
jgi:hypothetical protein